jgi:hypothetical protein
LPSVTLFREYTRKNQSCHLPGRGTGHAALHLEEAQPSGARVTAFDVVAELLDLVVGGLEAKTTLHLHDDDAGGRDLGARGGMDFSCALAALIASSGKVTSISFFLA